MGDEQAVARQTHALVVDYAHVCSRWRRLTGLEACERLDCVYAHRPASAGFLDLAVRTTFCMVRGDCLRLSSAIPARYRAVRNWPTIGFAEIHSSKVSVFSFRLPWCHKLALYT